jgi:hypothetical protein
MARPLLLEFPGAVYHGSLGSDLRITLSHLCFIQSKPGYYPLNTQFPGRNRTDRSLPPSEHIPCSFGSHVAQGPLLKACISPSKISV